MKNETKNCQNCKNDFTIEGEDFKFYEKMQVPPPTFCPDCRRMRRMAWRNERALYKRSCQLCNKNIISMYREDSPIPVLCQQCWYGDDWDATTYARDYDFSRNFFEQYVELLNVVPQKSLWQRNAINSEYSNMVGESKNVYLSASVTAGSENVFYSKHIDGSSNIVDCYNLKKCENCYENIDCEKNYNCQYLVLSRDCLDSYFLFDCVNCSNCFMSWNLRNKQYCIRNKQYTKEAYELEIGQIKLSNRRTIAFLLQEFEDVQKRAIHKFANNTKVIDSTGNNLANTKNCHSCFDIYNTEDSKYCYRGYNMNNCMDFDYGLSGNMYEYITGALNDYNVRFSISAESNVKEADYTNSCISCDSIFGCVGLRNKKYAILNKVYSKEEYEMLRKKIIDQMEEMQYVDKSGNKYKYGEFFPLELSPHSYNETLAQDFYPLTKLEAINKGLSWFEPDSKRFSITMPVQNNPADISLVDESILNEVIECSHLGKCNHQCSTVFRVTPGEFQFYKKLNIPLPDKCSNCRYHERFKKVTLPKLYHRSCMNQGCQNEFETAYAPDRPEMVYCEKCYQSEVY